MDTQSDTVIVGGVAAGPAAGIVLARAKGLIVDGGDPRSAPAAHIHGLLSRDGLAPLDSFATGGDGSTDYSGSLRSAEGTGALRSTDGTLELGSDRTVGTRSVLPEIPGLREHWLEQDLTGAKRGAER